MASEVGIINVALRKLGASAITSRTDDTDEAIAANGQFDDLRDTLLRSHPWNFAVRRVQLAQSATAPATGYDYQYPIPTDFLRALIVADSDLAHTGVEYRIESHATDGTVILSDANELFLTYIAQITDPNKMTPDFRRALSLALAVDLSVTLTNSATLMERIAQEAQAALRSAKSTDAIEDFPEQRPEGSWVTARYGAGVTWPR